MTPHFDSVRFAFLVQKWMAKHGHSIRDAAQVLGISRSMLHRLLDDEGSLPVGSFLHTCRLLGINPDDFYLVK